MMEAPVNYVNAPVVAKERGIEVKEVKSSDVGDFTSLIRVRVEAGKKSYQKCPLSCRAESSAPRIAPGSLFERQERRRSLVPADLRFVALFERDHLRMVVRDDECRPPRNHDADARVLAEHEMIDLFDGIVKGEPDPEVKDAARDGPVIGRRSERSGRHDAVAHDLVAELASVQKDAATQTRRRTRVVNEDSFRPT